MAITLEQVERLREKGGLSYEEARRILEETQGDLLEALIRLERQGRIRGGGSGAFYSTRPGGDTAPSGPASPAGPSSEEPSRFRGLSLTVGGARRNGQDRTQGDRPGFWGQVKELLAAALDLLRHSTVNQFEVWRRGERMTTMPVLILILLLVMVFWISLPLLIVGLFFGCKYRFSGPDMNREKVDEVVEQVTTAVSGVVEQVKEEFGRAVHKKEK